MRPEKPPRVPIEGPAADGQTYDPRYMVPCSHYTDADHGGPGYCWSTPTRHGAQGPTCKDHTQAKLHGRDTVRPDPNLTAEGIFRRKRTAGAPDQAPPSPQSASRVHDDRAVTSGKRRSTPEAYREAKARVAAAAR